MILATGADAVRLTLPGADRYFLRGVAYSTVSYAPLYIDKTVALIGAGAMALRGAAELAQIVKAALSGSRRRTANWTRPWAAGCRRQSHVSLLENWAAVAVEGDTFARQSGGQVARRRAAHVGRGRRSLSSLASSPIPS